MGWKLSQKTALGPFVAISHRARTEKKPASCSGHTDIEKSPLLFYGGPAFAHGVVVRERVVLKCRDKNDRKFKTLGLMKSHDRHGGLANIRSSKAAGNALFLELRVN